VAGCRSDREATSMLALAFLGTAGRPPKHNDETVNNINGLAERPQGTSSARAHIDLSRKADQAANPKPMGKHGGDRVTQEQVCNTNLQWNNDGAYMAARLRNLV